MKITIVVPVYNVAPFIGDCIQSVMCQTWKDRLECIFVDDCGTDDSMDIIRRMIHDYHGPVEFRIENHERNQGLSAARNTGMDAATGDYVYFLDSDDEITSDCIEILARPLLREHYDMSIADYRVVGTGMPQIPLKMSDGEVLKGSEVVHAYRQKNWYMMAVNKLYRTDFLNQYGLRFKEGIIHEDELWSFQVACLAQSMAVVRQETYIYKLREGSITVREFSPRRAESMNIILKEMCAFAEKYGLQRHKDVHNIIQNFRIDCLDKVKNGAPSLFRKFYRDQRRMMSSSWLDCCQVNGCDIKKQVRDLHMLLPFPIAYPYLCRMLSYYDKQL